MSDRGIFRWTTDDIDPSLRGFDKAARTQAPVSVAELVKLPCPGLTKADDPRIEGYLTRPSGDGGGSRSLAVIAKERYDKPFRALTSTEQDVVRDVRGHEERWRNKREQGRVYHVECKKNVESPADGGAGKRVLPCERCNSLLKDGQFRRAIKVPVPNDANYKYTNKKYTHEGLVSIYARVKGLRELIEDPVRIHDILYCILELTLVCQDLHKSPFIQFAQGVAAGKPAYQNHEFFMGLVDVFTRKVALEEEGKSTRNFKYPLAYDE
ncbi:hypothetical protein PUNSTDRAFT_56266, partial [Punctularia strigosozonata HHB-11173 SS5]|uniref:uncharacterized protein n=1 Tax=Punctularia strigosozonata (strain HHB-11173) TaxID=741275 RepID=UPI00044175C0